MDLPRKYQLIRQIKAAGFKMKKMNRERKIIVPVNRITEAEENNAVKEMVNYFGYSVLIGEWEPTLAELKAQNAIHHSIKLIDSKTVTPN